MRRVAANIVYINNIEFYKNHVVELYEHLIVNHYSLDGELAMTEWFTGTIIIHERYAYLIQKKLTPENVNDIYTILSSAPKLCTDYSCGYGNIKRL